MSPFLSKASKIKLRVLAWYQIVGGIVGLGITFWLIFRVGQVNSLMILIILFALALYAFSIYSGRLLLIDKYSKGLRLTIINQALQVLQFAMMGYGYLYVSGLMLTVGIKVENGFTFDFNFALASTWNMSIASSETAFNISINLVAIYFIYFSNKLKSTIEKEKASYEEQEISEEPGDEKLALEI
ncbi:MAG: hypothetical protein JST50_21845 [Bacteroidetes bacterium]|jgi:hypothetical protein|nr:hypothetical protein [Bacteroidota bacterium]